jgi:hypothetical protein
MTVVIQKHGLDRRMASPQVNQRSVIHRSCCSAQYASLLRQRAEAAFWNPVLK